MKTLWTLLMALAMGLSLLALPACETTEGFGRDLEKAGEELSDEADEQGYDDNHVDVDHDHDRVDVDVD